MYRYKNINLNGQTEKVYVLNKLYFGHEGQYGEPELIGEINGSMVRLVEQSGISESEEDWTVVDRFGSSVR